jgi:hypothetical protein
LRALERLDINLIHLANWYELSEDSEVARQYKEDRKIIIKQLKGLQRWGLKHLKIMCRGTGFTDDNQDHDELACAIISHCKPKSLTSLHIFEGIHSGVY